MNKRQALKVLLRGGKVRLESWKIKFFEMGADGTIYSNVGTIVVWNQRKAKPDDAWAVVEVTE